MEYREGPPVQLEFSVVEHMWLGLPLNDVIWIVDETDIGQYRADQLLAAADTLFEKTTEIDNRRFNSHIPQGVNFEEKCTLARRIMAAVATHVSCDVSEILDYVYAQTDEHDG